jgi:CubicO group peptidase (beta-lactamase class C family)
MRLLFLAFAFVAFTAQAQYYPDATWQHKTPTEAGFDEKKLREAIDFAIASESKSPRNWTENHYRTFGREPHGTLIGPVKDRGEMTGLVIHRGYIVAEWGEPSRIDMTHSVTKSLLSTVVGVAHDRGLIRTLDDPVHPYVPPVLRYPSNELIQPFDTPHNRLITWDHLLRQTSDFEGTLWGKPDWADRPRGNPSEWTTRPRNKPGTTYKYNDVRVNALAFAALAVWRKPLPQVLKENVMDPIGASNTWRWYGYESSWVVVDGAAVQSVSGGGHWGGGVFINAYDMGRFGLLTLRKGKWKERQLVSSQWIEWSLTPTPVEPGYGFMNFYLNGDGKLLPSAPRTAYGHVGNGVNFIYVDPENDIVAVLRWIEDPAVDGFVKRLIAALR